MSSPSGLGALRLATHFQAWRQRSGSPHRGDRLTQHECRLFPRRKVPAFVDPVVVNELGICPLSPASAASAQLTYDAAFDEHHDCTTFVFVIGQAISSGCCQRLELLEGLTVSRFHFDHHVAHAPPLLGESGAADTNGDEEDNNQGVHACLLLQFGCRLRHGRRRRSTRSASETLMRNGRIALLSAATAKCSGSRLTAPMIAEVAIRSRRVGDVADMTFSFVAHVRRTQRRCIDVPGAKVNLLYEGVLDTFGSGRWDEFGCTSVSSKAHSAVHRLGSNASTTSSGCG